METCSPDAKSTSSSRRLGRGVRRWAKPKSRSVSPAMAETTTTTSWPSARVAATLPATSSIRSQSATEVPPYFWTMRAKGNPVRGVRPAESSYFSPDPLRDGLQGPIQFGRIGAARLGHVRAPTALAAHLLGHHVHELTGLHLGGEIGGHPRDQAHLPVAGRAQHYDRRAQLVLELVHEVAQGCRIHPIHHRG